MGHQGVANNDFDPVEDLLLPCWSEGEVDIGRLDSWFFSTPATVESSDIWLRAEMEQAVYVSEVLDAIECSKKRKAYKRRGRGAVVTN